MVKLSIGLVIGCLFLVFNVKGQNTIHIPSVEVEEQYDNVYMTQIAGDSLVTQFLIWIKDTVPTHHHVWHSESIYVLEGTARMYINDSIQDIKSGDLIFLPKKNRHAVKVTSDEPLKVLSIQSPGYLEEDRVFDR